MNIKELREDKNLLEMSIRQELDSLLDAFEAKTGFYPQSVSINMFEATTIDSSERKYRLGGVTVDIKI